MPRNWPYRNLCALLYNLDLLSSGHNIADAANNSLTNTTPTETDETYTVTTN